MNNFNQGVLTLFAILLVFEFVVETRRKWMWVAASAALFSAASLSAAAVGMERWGASLALSATMSGLCLCYLWYERRSRRPEKLARRHAVRLGVAVADTERVMPAKDGGPEKVAVARYALPRRPGGAPRSWMLARLEGVEGADLGHGWRLRTGGGEAAEAMKAILRGIAAQARNEQLEFEADEGEVRAYWKEWGGSDRAEDVHSWLQALAKY